MNKFKKLYTNILKCYTKTEGIMIDQIIVNGDEVISYVLLMYRHLQRFNDEISSMKKMKDTIVWESVNKTKLMTIYDEMISEFLKFSNNMVQYVEFLEKYVDGYEEVLEEIKGEFRKLDMEVIEGVNEGY